METGWFAVFSPADDALGWDAVNAPALYFALVYSKGWGGGVQNGMVRPRFIKDRRAGRQTAALLKLEKKT